MNIGMVGMGKLGLPVALAIEHAGHKVMGYDPDPSGRVETVLGTKAGMEDEHMAMHYLAQTKIQNIPLNELVAWADILFVAVQTPHDERYEGTQPVATLNQEWKDFDYTYLRDCLHDIKNELETTTNMPIITIISTCLPGTVDGLIDELPANMRGQIVYNPFFIAMGTVIRDFTSPEFVLMGGSEEAKNILTTFYATIHSAPIKPMQIIEAEMVKVTYNTMIGMKVMYANLLMEMCHKLGADCDVVSDAIKSANQRLISPAYLSGGMGDGGSCHPRDNIAMAKLADDILEYNPFEWIMQTRDDQTEWLANMIRHYAHNLPVCIYGLSFKPDVKIKTGSPAVLLLNMLGDLKPHVYDPVVGEGEPARGPAVIFLACRHSAFLSIDFPAGSVVIDPFRYIETNPSITKCNLIQIGRQYAQS